MSLLALATAPAALSGVAAGAMYPVPGFGANVKVDAARGTAGDGDNEPAIIVDQAGTAWVNWQQRLMLPSYAVSTTDGIHFSAPVEPDPTSTDGDVAWATTSFPSVGHDTTITNPGQSTVFYGQLGGGTCGAAGNPMGGSQAIQIRVAPATDNGAGWAPQDATCQPAQVDRDWLAAYTPPASRGTPDAVKSTHVYTEHHDFGISNVWFTGSADGGATWGVPAGQPVSIEQAGSAAQQTSVCNTIPGGIAVDQNGTHQGRIYAIWEASDPIYSVGGCNVTQAQPFDHIFVSYSDNQGGTWTSRSVFNDVCAPNPPMPPMVMPNPGSPTIVTSCQDISELFTSIAVDDAGNVYVAFISRGQLSGGGTPEYDAYLSVSQDGGDHWNGATGDTPGPPYKVNSDTGTHYEPWVAAGGNGGVDVVYYRTSEVAQPSTVANKPQATSNSAVWGVYMSQSLDGGKTWQESRIDDAGANGIYFGDICSVGIFCGMTVPPTSNWGPDRTLYDVFGVAIGPDGAARVAWTDARDTITGACQPGAAPACEGGPGGKTRVYFACQTRGMGLHGELLSGVCPHAGVAAVTASPSPVATMSPSPPAAPSPSPSPSHGAVLPNSSPAAGLAAGLLLALATLALGAASSRRRLTR